MTRDDLTDAMAKARWESLSGDTFWKELSPEWQVAQRRDLEVAAYAVVAFVGEWLLDCGTAEDKQLVAQWYEDMETPAERYARLNVRLPDGRRLLGPPDPPVVSGRPREVGGWGE